ncbi:MAG: hypothetical protein KGN78_04810 [Actinomycetales bacterium]|nr:hypothetical protein [Actinomycetales bacterium]
MPTVKQLSRIFSDDNSLNRLQDQLASALNPILRNVQGDLSGPLESPSVVALQGRAVSSVAPATGNALIWTGSQWAPGTAGGGGFITSVLPPLVVVSGVLSIPQANATTDGYLSAADWVTFNSKISGVTATSPLSATGTSTRNIALTGVVAAANGGTGLSSPGTVGYVLTSTGTGWTSSAVPGGTPSGPAGGVLGYTASTYPNPNGLAAVTFGIPGEGHIPVRYGADTFGNPVTTIFQQDDSVYVQNNVNRSIGMRAGKALTGQFGTNVIGGDITLKGGIGATNYSGGGGGAAYLLGGDGGGGSWPGGAALVQGGIGASTDGVGGAAEVVGGTGQGTGDGGVARLKGGFAGPSAAAGGNAYVEGGSGGAGRNGGDVYILGGANQLTNATGGDVTIRGGDGTTDGTVFIGDTVTAAVKLATTSIKTHINGPTRLTPKATQTITAATDDFDPTTTYLPFDVSGGNYTLTSTPTILTANAVAGQIVILHNIGTTNHIKVDRGTGQALSLAAPTQTINPGGSMVLVFDGSYWNEIAHITATSV